MNITVVARALILAALGLAQTFAAHAQTTTFTYQGRLNDGTAPANGLYDLTFTLQSAAGGPAQVGGTLTNIATVVSDGLFTVSLDFGGAFPGADRWLEIGVRTNGTGNFVALSPRQPLTATPYAITAASATAYAGPVNAGQISGTISPSNIGEGSITSTMLAAGSVTSNQMAKGSVATSTLIDGAVGLPQLTTLTSAPLLTTITNPTSEKFDYLFGSAVAAVGSDRVLIGAKGLPYVELANVGSAYLFSTNGTLLTAFTNPTPDPADSFGSAVAVLGNDRVLIGAPGDNTGWSNAGSAYLFDTNGTLLTAFTNPSPDFTDSFGGAVVAVGREMVLIGAPGDNTGEFKAGSAYLFSTNGTLLATFNNPAPTSYDYFASAVAAIGSDRIVIGAPGHSSHPTDGGAAYLFSTNGALLVAFSNPTPSPYDAFGGAVAAVGSDRVLVGDFGDKNYVGSAYLFSTNGTLLTTFTNPTPNIGDYFGRAVAAVGSDRVLVGASLDDTSAEGAGSAYLFGTNGALLATFTNPTPAKNDYFGVALSAVGSDRVLIGAMWDDTDGEAAGAAYLFSLSGAPYVPGLVSQGVVDGSIGTAGLAPGAVTSDKIADGSIASNALSAGLLNSTFWKLGGNKGTAPGTQFLGTTDNQPLEFKVNNRRAWRLEPSAENSMYGGIVNVLGGSPANAVGPGVYGAVIGGGGAVRYHDLPGANRVDADFGTLGGGLNNTIQTGAQFSTLGGGIQNTIRSNAFYSTIGGGTLNTNHSNGSTIGGGYLNTIQTNAVASIIGGGENNTIQTNGSFATIPGGFRNVAASYAFAAGRRAKAIHTGTFVWGDSTDLDIVSTDPDSVTMRASGGYRLFSNSGATAGVSLAAGGTSWGVISDRNVKKDFAPVGTVEVLEKLAALPIMQWHYNWETEDTTPHIGPMAQDFKAAFYPGADDKVITTQEADGVALAAIQGLNQKVEAQRDELNRKQTEIIELKARLERLEDLMNRKLNGDAQ